VILKRLLTGEAIGGNVLRNLLTKFNNMGEMELNGSKSMMENYTINIGI